LETENNQLKNQVKATKSKKQPKDIAYLAKFVLYHRLKDNDEILQTIGNRLKAADVSLKKMVKGKEVEVIPWMIIKQYADAEYAKMSAEDKEELHNATKLKYDIE
jgi:hypothetical protein